MGVGVYFSGPSFMLITRGGACVVGCVVISATSCIMSTTALLSTYGLALSLPHSLSLFISLFHWHGPADEDQRKKMGVSRVCVRARVVYLESTHQLFSLLAAAAAAPTAAATARPLAAAATAAARPLAAPSGRSVGPPAAAGVARGARPASSVALSFRHLERERNGVVFDSLGCKVALHVLTERTTAPRVVKPCVKDPDTRHVAERTLFAGVAPSFKNVPREYAIASRR